MKTQRLLLVLLVISIPACSKKGAPRRRAAAPPGSAAVGKRLGPSADLARLKRRYLEGLFRAKPHLATFMGDHRFDGKLPDFSPITRTRRLAQLRAQRRRLDRLAGRLVSLDDRIDAEVLRDGIDLEILYLTEIKPWTRDPRFHDSFPYYDPREIVAGRLSDIIHGDFAPRAARQRSVVEQLRGLPAFVTQARSLLQRPAKIYVKHAIRANAARLKFLDANVAPFVKGVAGGTAALAGAKAALRGYQTFLTDDLARRATGDWRLGAKLFRKKFPLALQTRLSPEEVVRRAHRAFARARSQLVLIAQKLYRKLWPDKKLPSSTDSPARARLIRQVQARLSRDHPRAGELVKAHAANLDRMRAFIEKHDLLTLPPRSTLAVEEIPAFKRGAYGAEYLAPGVLEKRSRWRATYYVSPVDPTWPAEKTASFLRGNNFYRVEITALHEAYPGHHTQYSYARQRLNPLRAVLWNAPMVEGWAVYGQEQMIKLGYGGSRNDRYRFFELQILMVVAHNAILDILLHTGQMTEREAVRMMVEDGFQEKAVAQRKLARAKLDSTQLTQYFLGLTEIEGLERDYRKKVGAHFKQRKFNEAVIGHGSLAVRHLRAYLLGERDRP